MSDVEVTIQVPAELVAWLRGGAGVLRQRDVSGGASNALARLVLDALPEPPRPIEVGDRARDVAAVGADAGGWVVTRYAIARQERGEFLAGPAVPVLDLPDAEHIHLHRRPDGTWTTAAMEEQTFAPRMWEYVARCFHAHYERLASDFGHETRPESAVAWQNVPERNRQLMVATVGHVLRDIRDTGRLWVDAPVQGDDREDGAR